MFNTLSVTLTLRDICKELNLKNWQIVQGVIKVTFRWGKRVFYIRTKDLTKWVVTEYVSSGEIQTDKAFYFEKLINARLPKC